MEQIFELNISTKNKISVYNAVSEKAPEAEIEIHSALGGSLDIVSIVIDSSALLISVVSLVMQLRDNKKNETTLNNITVYKEGKKKVVELNNMPIEDVIKLINSNTDAENP